MTPLWQTSATELVQRLRSRQIKATEILQHCQQQINRHNDDLKAFITLCWEQAEAQAQVIDQALDRGDFVGLLAGLPFSLLLLRLRKAGTKIRTNTRCVLPQIYAPDRCYGRYSLVWLRVSMLLLEESGALPLLCSGGKSHECRSSTRCDDREKTSSEKQSLLYLAR